MPSRPVAARQQRHNLQFLAALAMISRPASNGSSASVSAKCAVRHRINVQKALRSADLLERGEQAFASFPIERGKPLPKTIIAASRSSRSVCIEPICSSNSWSSCSARRLTGPSRSRIRRSSLTSTTSRGGVFRIDFRVGQNCLRFAVETFGNALCNDVAVRLRCSTCASVRTRASRDCRVLLPSPACVSFAQPVFHFRKTVRGLSSLPEPAIKSIRVVRCVSISFGRAASCSSSGSPPRRA